jgi:hypothetical protein
VITTTKYFAEKWSQHQSISLGSDHNTRFIFCSKVTVNTRAFRWEVIIAQDLFFAGKWLLTLEHFAGKWSQYQNILPIHQFQSHIQGGLHGNKAFTTASFVGYCYTRRHLRNDVQQHHIAFFCKDFTLTDYTALRPRTWQPTLLQPWKLQTSNMTLFTATIKGNVFN